MILVMQYLDTLCSLSKVMLSQLGQIIVYDWDGEQPPGHREAFLDMAGGAFSLDTGINSGSYGWVSMKRCGNPYVNIEITTYAGTGAVRDVEFDIDYGELVNGIMQVIHTQREKNTEPIEYGPFVGIHRMSFDKGYGGYIRIRQVRNVGALVSLQFRGSASMKPMPSLTTLDRDVQVV